MPTQDEFYAKDRAAWRKWLHHHQTQPAGIWLIFDKGKNRTLSYEEIVEEALCFGWIDSLGRSHSDTQTKLWMAPRKPKSAWSRPNKERVERLIARGLMEPAGYRSIEIAKANGTWTKLDDVENLVEDDDLATELDADPKARSNWDSFPRSVKRGILEWIGQTKNEATRAARIEETVTEAAAGRRAHQWRQPKSTSPAARTAAE